MNPEEEKMWEVALQMPVWEKNEGKKVLQTLKQILQSVEIIVVQISTLWPKADPEWSKGNYELEGEVEQSYQPTTALSPSFLHHSG